jgi:hypothetical protein
MGCGVTVSGERRHPPIVATTAASAETHHREVPRSSITGLDYPGRPSLASRGERRA